MIYGYLLSLGLYGITSLISYSGHGEHHDGRSHLIAVKR